MCLIAVPIEQFAFIFILRYDCLLLLARAAPLFRMCLIKSSEVEALLLINRIGVIGESLQSRGNRSLIKSATVLLPPV
jgi:hypothetical protein